MSFSLSAKEHYACLAMLELAIRHDERRPVALREITSRHLIPQPFLVQILQQLKQANFVTSTRGSQGGYRLSVDAQEVTLLEICEAVGCSDNGPAFESQDHTSEAAVLARTWNRAATAYRDVLAGIRLSELASESSRTATEPMFYI